jgi:hypothetical protein
MKKGVWRIEKGRYSLRDSDLPLPLRQKYTELPVSKVEDYNKELFLELELFFVKVYMAPFRTSPVF